MGETIYGNLENPLMPSALEKIYPYVPPMLQNIGLSLYGIQYHHERFGGNFKKYVSGFQERDRWSAAQMTAYTGECLQNLISRAFDKIPHYRTAWQKAGFTANGLKKITLSKLSTLPVLTKQEIRSNPRAFLAEGARPGPSYMTSGSTGTPLVCYYGPEDHRKFIAAREVRSFGWAGTSIHKSRSMIGGRLVIPQANAKPPYHRINWIEKQIYFSAFHIKPENVPYYVKAMNRHRPCVYTGYAYSHYLLGRMMLEQNLILDYEPEALILGSEKMTAGMKEVIQKAFRARAYEEYGAVENCLLATECEKSQLHISPDFGIVEIVDQEGRPVPPGREGRILCTGLLNETQPLIRYEIGDVGIGSEEKCPCGREGMPVLKEVSGRIEDVVVGPDGREMVRFHGIFIGLPDILEGQIIQQEKDLFHVRVVSTRELPEKTCEIIRLRFMERLGKVRVLIEKVSAIERTERGKFQAVISRIKK